MIHIYKISGMTCNNCKASIEKHLSELVEVYNASVNFEKGEVEVTLDKKSIRCACLGTALKLPMTEATFIENAIMIVMAIVMLL